ncbi:MAG: hypothetical protein MUP53_07615, partial [Bacteroidales bacterium]|nr:hypothetical protein [Bacteroidales bacterium]
MRKSGIIQLFIALFLISPVITGSGVFVPDFYTFSGNFYNDVDYDLVLNSSDTIFTTGYSSIAWDTDKYGAPVIAKESCIPPSPHDVHVCAYTRNGNLLWYTFLGNGGDSQAEGHAIDIVPGGALNIAGFSTNSWPLAKYGIPVYTHNGTDPDWNYPDILVAALTQSGTLNWYSFLGGTSSDRGYDVKTSATGDIYITGTSGAWDTARFGDPAHQFNAGYSWISDVFVAKLNSSGILQWYTFLGAVDGYDSGYAIEVSSAGDIYVTGSSPGSWDTAEYGTPLRSFNSGKDIFVAKLNDSGIVQWYTFLGSDNDDEAKDIILNNGNVLITGNSAGSWDTLKYGDPALGHNGSDDIVVCALDPVSGAVQWYSFYGGPGADYGEAIRASSGNDLFFTGYTTGLFDTSKYGDPVKTVNSEKIFVFKADNSGAPLWYTFIG